MSYIEWIVAAADDAHSSQGNIEEGDPQTSETGGQADLELMEDSRQEESWETERVRKDLSKTDGRDVAAVHEVLDRDREIAFAVWDGNSSGRR